MILTGERKPSGRGDIQRGPHPTGRRVSSGPRGSRRRQTGQATKYLFSVALLRPLQTEFLLNLAPKLLGLGLAWLLREK